MVVHVEFQSLIGGANCVNSGAADSPAAPPPKRLLRTLSKKHNDSSSGMQNFIDFLYKMMEWRAIESTLLLGG